MRPSQLLIRCVLIWFLAAIALAGLRASSSDNIFQLESLSALSGNLRLLENIWWWSFSGFALVATFDLIRKNSFSEIIVERQLPHSLALGVHAQITTIITNPCAYKLHLSVTELLPKNIVTNQLPIEADVDAYGSRTISYWVEPILRGEALFTNTCLRVTTRWKLWQKLQKIDNPETIKIYPNFAPIAKSASIGLEHQLAQLGVHLLQRRGEGSDFHQLREFRDGDSLRQIDWKATAKHRKPIAREYQDERDQDVFFLLDCGRRLRNKDDDISHFDHALNALLITSYIALRQGDGVGLMSFAGAFRWLPPVKGPAQINQILNQLYDLYSSTQTSDYLQAAEEFLARHNKRALVILVTNAHEEDVEDLTAAAQLLSKKHIVMVASLRDLFWDQLLSENINNFAGALKFCGTSLHLAKRRQLLAQLQHLGVIMTDSLPHQLHIDLVYEYMRLKRSGRL